MKLINALVFRQGALACLTMSASAEPNSEQPTPEYTIIEGRRARLRVPTGIHPAGFAGYRWAGPATAQQDAFREAGFRCYGLPTDPAEAWKELWDEETHNDEYKISEHCKLRFEMRITATETKDKRYGTEYWVPLSTDGWTAGMSVEDPPRLAIPGLSVSVGPLTEPLRELRVPAWLYPAVWAARKWSAVESRGDDGFALFREPDATIKAVQDQHGLSVETDVAWGQLWRQEQEEGGAGFGGVAEAMGIGFKEVEAPIIGDRQWIPVHVESS